MGKHCFTYKYEWLSIINYFQPPILICANVTTRRLWHLNTPQQSSYTMITSPGLMVVLRAVIFRVATNLAPSLWAVGCGPPSPLSGWGPGLSYCWPSGPHWCPWWCWNLHWLLPGSARHHPLQPPPQRLWPLPLTGTPCPLCLTPPEKERWHHEEVGEGPMCFRPDRCDLISVFGWWFGFCEATANSGRWMIQVNTETYDYTIEKYSWRDVCVSNISCHVITAS